MKNYIYLITIVVGLISLESCRKEEITDGPVIVDDEPILVDFQVVNGRVVSGELPIENAAVNVYQNEEFIGETLTDNEGRFTTYPLELDHEGAVTFEAFKTEFNYTYRRRPINEIVGKDIVIPLFPVNNPAEVSSLPNPESEDLITFSGYVKDLNGNPSSFKGITHWSEVDSTGFMIDWLYFMNADNQGYYEYLFPANKILYVSLQDLFCEHYITEEETTVSGSPFQFEVFGPFNQDVINPDFINPYTAQPYYAIEGELQNCDGNLVYGEVSLEIDNIVEQPRVFVQEATNGMFSFDSEFCTSLPYNLKIWGNDLLNNKQSDTIEMTITEPETDLVLELVACTQLQTEFSEVTFNANGNVYSFSKTKVYKSGDDIVSDEPGESSALFIIPDAKLGDNAIHNFEMFNWFTGAYFQAVDGTITLTITNLTANSAQVNFEGKFTDATGQQIDGDGTMNLSF